MGGIQKTQSKIKKDKSSLALTYLDCLSLVWNERVTLIICCILYSAVRV